MTLKENARQVLALLEAGSYPTPSGRLMPIADWQRSAVTGTRLYRPEQLAELRAISSPGGPPPRISVPDETTQTAACRLVQGEGVTDLALLNFASARNVGGGFLNGAKAQEEDLCRCSGLYPCLAPQQEYYRANRGQDSLLYTDFMIYSPNVPFFKVRGRGVFLEKPFVASVITAPAPNTGPLLRKNPSAGPAITGTFVSRWGSVLAIARDQGHRNLLLGAWGCGAFGGDPQVAASTLRDCLADQRFSGAFDQVVLAIPGKGKRSGKNLEVFRRVFEI